MLGITEGVAIAIITGMFSLLAMYIKQKLDIRKIKKKESFRQVIPKVHHIYDLLNELKTHTKAVRVLILKTENNGGRPKGGCVLKSSIVYEVFDSPLEPIKETWQQQVLDEEYVDILTQMMSNPQRRKSVVTGKLKDHSILKRVYLATGVHSSVLYEIQEREKEYFYLSIIYDKQIDKTAEEFNTKRDFVNRIRLVFSDNWTKTIA